MHKSIRLTLVGALSLQLWGCAATKPQSENQQAQASASPVAEIKPPSPDNADELYAYAVKLEEQGKDEEALSYYLQATQINPEHLKAHIALAQLYTKFSRKDEARVAYENVLRLDRNHPFVAQYKEARLKYYSAQNIAQNEEYDKALKLIGEAPRGTPMDDEILAKEKEWQGLMQSGSDVRKSQEIIEQASLLAYQGKYQNAIDLIKTAPDADTNPTVADKLSQWQKAQQNQPVAEPSRAPSTGSRKTQFVQGDDVQLRQSPYLYAESLASLRHGTAVEILLDKGYEADGYQWTKVKTDDGKVGWIAANLLSGSLNRPSAASSSRPSSNSTPRPQATPAPVVPMKTYGTRYIKGDQVNVRRSPSTNGTLVGQGTEGAPVILLSEQNVQADGYHWAKIKLPNGQIGWVASQYLRGPQQAPAASATPKPVASTKPASTPSPAATAKPVVKPATGPKIAQIVGVDINVRSAPNATASVVTLVSAPTKVTLINAKPVRQGALVWQQIQLPGGKKGWIASQFLGGAKTPAKPAAQAANNKRYIRGDQVNIRSNPATSASVITRATEGTPVTLLSTTPTKKDGHSWYKIRLATGQIGWIAADFIGK